MFIVIPKRIVNVIVANINNISSLNEEITTELDSAIAIANHDLGPYITNGKPLSGWIILFFLFLKYIFRKISHLIFQYLIIAKASVIIEVLRILGEYLGDVTNSISKSTHVNPSQLPVTPINHEQDVVGTVQNPFFFFLYECKWYFIYTHIFAYTYRNASTTSRAE